MKRYQVKNKLTGAICGVFETPGEAGKWVEEYTHKQNEGLDPNYEGYCSPFDFSLEEIEITRRDVDGNGRGLVFPSWLGGCCLVIHGLTRSRASAIRALDRLLTIAQRWNEEDGFVPDFSNKDQRKYFPWFEYNKDAAGFVYANTGWTATSAGAGVGSLICFATPERATAFGRQFESEFNDFLMNK